MGFDNFGSDDDEEQTTDPSGTHIYFYERGHDRLPGEEGDARYEEIAEAYEKARTSPDGIVRRFANSQFEGGLQQFLAEYTNAVGNALEEGDLSILMKTLFEDESVETQVEMLATYLDDNPEVLKELAERLNSTEGAAEEGED